MAIDVGDLHRLSYDHKSPAGDLVNAGTMTLTITLPDGTPFAAGTVAPGSTGRYTYDYQTTLAGRHLARWLGTGANPGAYSEAFDVRPAAPDYLISLADARQALTSTDAAAAAMAAHDDELRLFVEAATGAVERHLNEVVLRRTITEYHQLDRPWTTLVLRRGPVISLTSVGTVDGARTWDVAGLHVDPATGVVTVVTETPLAGHLQVVYVAGYEVAPGNYVLATRIVLQHLWSTQRGSRGAPRVGGMADTLAVSGVGFAIPNAALELLGDGMPGIA